MTAGWVRYRVARGSSKYISRDWVKRDKEDHHHLRYLQHNPDSVLYIILTDRASTIPSIIRSCQSDTWFAEHENIRGTATKFQREHENEKRKKNGTRYREFGILLATSHPIHPRDRNYLAFAPKEYGIYNNTILSGFQASLNVCVNQ